MGCITENNLFQKLSDFEKGTEPPQPIVRGKLDFALPEELVHVKYGRGFIRGSIHLIVPEGEYRPTSAEGETRAIEYLTSWMDEHHVTLGNLKYRNTLTRNSVGFLGAALRGEIDQPSSMAAVLLNMIVTRIDDIEEETQLFSRMRGNVKEIQSSSPQIVKDILCGKYKNFEDLPTVEFPIVQPILSLGFLMSQLAPIDPDVMEQCPKGYKKVIQAFETVSTEFDFLEACSDEMYKMVRAQDAGFLSFGEWQAATNGWIIESDIRSDLLFLRATDACARVGGLINDLMGIRKDLADERPVNFVLRKVRRDGMTLEEAVNNVVGEINSELRDMVLCGRKLMEQHDDHEALSKYFSNMFYETEGHIRGYGSWGAQAKYGELNITESYHAL